MAKLVFPSVKSPYRGFMGEVRGWLNRIASYVDNSPGAKVEVAKQLEPLLTYVGYVPTIPGNQKLITSTVKVTAPAVTGTYVNGYTFTITNGNITAIVAS